MRHRELSAILRVAILASATATWATPIGVPFDIDVTGLFNHDVIVNNGGRDHSGYTAQGIYGDSAQDQVDKASRIWMSQSVANAHTGGPTGSRNGLPDDGFFAANAYHPDIHLSYNNNDDGPNALTSTASNFSFGFNVPEYAYIDLMVFATTGSGSATLDVTLNYKAGSSDTRSVYVPDWFNEIAQDNEKFYLIDGLDRMNRSNGAYENNNDPAIFGFYLHPDGSRVLTSVDVVKVGGGGSRLNFYGATGIIPEPGTLAVLALAMGLAIRRRRRA